MGSRKRLVFAGLAGLVVAAVPTSAWAHAVFLSSESVPKDSEAKITFSVPVEEEGHTHAMGEEEPATAYNQKVEIEVPRGFEVVSCDQTADWKCEAEPNEGSPSAGQAHGGTVTFTRVTTSGSNMDHLSFTVHTPTHIGTYRFPTTQTLSDGDETEWKGDGVTSEHPAPTVRVVDEDSDDADHGDDHGHDHK